jgi:hypothetical protein
VDAYNPLAEEVAARVTRGTKIVVHGYLKQDEWTDKATGARRSAVKVRPGGGPGARGRLRGLLPASGPVAIKSKPGAAKRKACWLG